MTPTRRATQLGIVFLIALGHPHVVRAQAATTAAQNKAASTAKVTQLLAGSGYPYRKTGDNTWVITREGRRPILIATGSEFVVFGIIVAVKHNMRVTQELDFNLLKLNHNLDYAKVGFDDDDDLFVRAELRIRIVDLPLLKATVDDLERAEDRAAKEVRPFLVTP